MLFLNLKMHPPFSCKPPIFRNIFHISFIDIVDHFLNFGNDLTCFSFIIKVLLSKFLIKKTFLAAIDFSIISPSAQSDLGRSPESYNWPHDSR